MFATKQVKNNANQTLSLVHKYIVELVILLLLPYSSVWNVKLHFPHSHGLYMCLISLSIWILSGCCGQLACLTSTLR